MGLATATDMFMKVALLNLYVNDMFIYIYIYIYIYIENEMQTLKNKHGLKHTHTHSAVIYYLLWNCRTGIIVFENIISLLFGNMTTRIFLFELAGNVHCM